MTSSRTFAATAVTFGVLALAHAVFTWPLRATLAFFAGGAVVAFVGEAVAIDAGWVEHHVGPKLAGVPLYVLFGWTGTIYAALRVALLVTDGWLAVAAAALLATGYDALTDHQGVAQGHWSYTGGPPGPRFRGVPWWNFAGWLVISTATAALAVPFL
jgi:uncharacterized membrane protein